MSAARAAHPWIRFSVVFGIGIAIVLAIFAATYFVLVLTDQLGTYKNTGSVADLDGDGDLDVIAANIRRESESTSFGGITLWINQGGGRFVPRQPEAPQGFAAAPGDLDGDGDVDLLVSNGYELTLGINQGGAQGGEAGAFQASYAIRPAHEPSDWQGYIDMGGSVFTGDLNNDRQVDGFVANCCYLSGLQQSGSPSLAPSSTWTWINERAPQGWIVRRTMSLTDPDGQPVRAAALGDIDGDGDLDIFAAIGAPDLDTGSSLILLNDGLGGFSDSGQRLEASGSASIALKDLDGDGDLDALVGAQRGALVWLNQGGAQGGQIGVFASSGQAGFGSPTAAVFLDDMNGDGSADAILAGPQQATIWWSDRRGTFTHSNQRFHYSRRHAVVVGDFNNDGLADIFAGMPGGDYHVWFNRGGGRFREGMW